MAFLQVEFYSKVLEGCTGINVLLPEPEQGIGVSAKGAKSAPPVLYLLHGLSDNQTIWCRRTSIERYAAAYGFAVVMPNAAASFYSNEKHGKRYWDFISDELPELVQSFFCVSSRREETFAAGLSMGGYGALKLALRRPEKYAAAASLSGVADVNEAYKNGFHEKLFKNIFGGGKTLNGGFDDLYAAAADTAMLNQKPKLYLGCGEKDEFYSMNRKFAETVLKMGYEVKETTDPTMGHQWEYWDSEILSVIKWMNGCLHMTERNKQQQACIK